MLKRLYFICAYLVSWLFFGAIALVFNGGCALLLFLPGRARYETVVGEVIRRLFRVWVAWLDGVGLVAIAWHGPKIRDLPHPAVYVANHPGLLDATVLLAYLPGAICLFKPQLRRNPFLAPAAIMAGYPSGDLGLDLIRDVAEKVARGRTLLLFPEGTRTRPDTVLNPLKSGFALIARRAGVPVQLLVIEASRDLLPKGRPWWCIPNFPAEIDIHVDRLIPHDPDRETGDLADEAGRRLAERLSAAP